MKLNVQFHFVSGRQFDDETSDFNSVSECVERMQTALGAERGTLTWVSPNGSTYVMNPANIVTVKVTP